MIDDMRNCFPFWERKARKGRGVVSVDSILPKRGIFQTRRGAKGLYRVESVFERVRERERGVCMYASGCMCALRIPRLERF